MKKIAVISLGGSLVFPNTGVDAKFVKKFRSLILSHVRRGWRFVIICGGGALARQYQDALRAIGVRDADALDWIGIHACRINAQYVRLVFGKEAREDIITDPTRVRASSFGRAHIVFGGGEKPGQTSDHVAVQCAINTGAAMLLNLSNVEYIYDRDPKEKGARPLTHVSWRSFKKLFPKKHTPGAHVPFDPSATRLAEQHALSVKFLDGHNFVHVAHALADHPFRGTHVSR